MKEIEDIKARHQRVTVKVVDPALSHDGDVCNYCSQWDNDDFEPWPCDTAFLLAEVERLEVGYKGATPQLWISYCALKAQLAQAEARCRELEECVNGARTGAGPVLLDP